MDNNRLFYASKTFLAPPAQGTTAVETAAPGLMHGTRRIMWAWLPAVEGPTLPWQGILSIPREVTLVVGPTGDPRRSSILRSYPIEELATLRGPRSLVSGFFLAGSTVHPLAVHGSMLDIEATLGFRPPKVFKSNHKPFVVSCGLRVLWREATFVSVTVQATFLPNGDVKKTVRVHDSGNKKFEVWPRLTNVEHVSFDVPTFQLPTKTSSSPSTTSASAHLRVLVDKGVVEVFVDKGAATHRLYHKPELSPAHSGVVQDRVAAFSENTADNSNGGECEFSELDTWPMRPFNGNIPFD